MSHSRAIQEPFKRFFKQEIILIALCLAVIHTGCSGKDTSILLHCSNRTAQATTYHIDCLQESVKFISLPANSIGGYAEKAILRENGKQISIGDFQKLIASCSRKGKLDYSVAAKIDSMQENEHAVVQIWHNYTGFANAKPPANKILSKAALDIAMAAAKVSFNQSVSNSRPQALLSYINSNSTWGRAVASMPVILAKMDKSQIQSVAKRTDVVAILEASTEENAGEVHSAYQYFWDADDAEVKESFSTLRIPFHGDGVKVGVYEWNGGCGLWRESATTPHAFSLWSGYTIPWTPAVHGCDTRPDGTQCAQACNNDVGYCRGGRCMKEHVTAVASKIGAIRQLSQTEYEIRNAAKMHLYYAPGPTRADSWSYLVNNGVHIVNDSESSSAADKVTANWHIRNHWITLTKSAGNNINNAVDCAENSICVGNFGVDQPDTDAWKADPSNSSGHSGMSQSTAYLDAVYDAEKPDAVGFGAGNPPAPKVTPASAEWTGMYGTSFSAPMVAGMVAVLQEYFPISAYYPELVRPIIIVSGMVHNIRDGMLSQNGGTDEWDGGGVPTASVAKNIIDSNQYWTGYLSPSNFQNGYYNTGTQISVDSGETLRVVLSWLYCSEAGASYISDFDLHVQEVHGTQLASSTSLLNSVEMIELSNTSGYTKTFNVLVQLWGTMGSCNGVIGEHLGLAWEKR